MSQSKKILAFSVIFCNCQKHRTSVLNVMSSQAPVSDDDKISVFEFDESDQSDIESSDDDDDVDPTYDNLEERETSNSDEEYIRYVLRCKLLYNLLGMMKVTHYIKRSS